MKLLIVDDDEQIRSGLEQGIDWSALDIQQVKTAANGLEAWQIFTDLFPEIVITDVRMPGMDGLELLQKIKTKTPQTKAIILSAYNDFEYLKKAIQLDAIDYEIKPIRARNLIALVKKVKEEIIKEQVTEQEFQKYLDSYKITFSEKLLSGEITDQLVIQEGLQQYYDFNPTGQLICISVQIDGDFKENKDRLPKNKSVINRFFAESDLASKGICLWSKEGKSVFLIESETNSRLNNMQLIKELTNRIRLWNQKLQDMYNISISAGVSNSGKISDLPRLYAETEKALCMRFYKGNNSIKVYDQSMEFNDRMITGLLENKKFISFLSQGNFTAVVTMVKDEYEYLKQECKYSRKSVSTYSSKLLQLLIVTVRNIPMDLIKTIQRKIEFIEVNEEYLTFDEFREEVIHGFKETDKRLSGNFSPMMTQAKEFILKNYHRNLTVGMIAEHIDISPNYFSHLFNREFGVPFNEYVNRIRIEKAKGLIINTNAKIYTISEKVGFTDCAYFTQVFKKIEGHPPAALRRKRRKLS